MHPLYDDEALVDAVTRRLVAAGRTVLQPWQTRSTERAHAERMLDVVAPPHKARVLSLGCGVGGMERYWHDVRPDLSFTLQNQSRAQLDACLCPGDRVLSDAQDFVRPWEAPPYDVAVMAYMLGHCDADRVLAAAVAATRGVLLVLDVAKAPADFERLLAYRPLDPWVLRRRRFVEVRQPEWHLIDLPDDATDEQRAAMRASVPGVWVRYH